MIRLLLRGLEWLDKRFPPKVTISKEVFEAMQEKAHKAGKALEAIRGEQFAINARIDAAEKSLSAIKEAVSKGGPLTPAAKDRMREDFIKGEGEAWGRPQAPGAKPVVSEAP